MLSWQLTPALLAASCVYPFFSLDINTFYTYKKRIFKWNCVVSKKFQSPNRLTIVWCKKRENIESSLSMETQKLMEKLKEIEARYLAASETERVGSASKVKASKVPKSVLRKRMRFFDLYDDDEARYSVMERAGGLLSCLENDVPHFVKFMLHSNVGQGFWLILPKTFCETFLPHQDTDVALVDEWGKEHKTTYLLARHGLSAGWRGFSISHRLLKGDAVIFHLIEPCKFKVHIVRVNRSDVICAALCLMGLHAESRAKKGSNRKRTKAEYVDPHLLNHTTHIEESEDREMVKPARTNTCYTKMSLMHDRSRGCVKCL